MIKINKFSWLLLILVKTSIIQPNFSMFSSKNLLSIATYGLVPVIIGNIVSAVDAFMHDSRKHPDTLIEFHEDTMEKYITQTASLIPDDQPNNYYHYNIKTYENSCEFFRQYTSESYREICRDKNFPRYFIKHCYRQNFSEMMQLNYTCFLSGLMIYAALSL